MPATADIPVSAIVVAAGAGRRLDADVRKQYLRIAGRSVLAHTLSRFDACREVESIIAVVPPEDIEFCSQRILSEVQLRCPVHLVAGGQERQHSVFNALQALDEEKKSGLVAVHDGVRPLVDPALISSCISCAAQFGACVPGIPADDTVKKADSKNRVVETVDRNGLWMIQTPQVFAYDLLYRAHMQALTDGCRGTDDAALVERTGHRVKIVPGSRTNIKITTAADLPIVEALLGAT